MSKKKGEKLLYSFKPSKLIIFMNFCLVMMFFFVPFLLVGHGSGNWMAAMYIGLFMSAVVGYLFWKELLDLTFLTCNLYPSYIEIIAGWIHISRRIVNYDNIVDIAYDLKLHERLLGVGTLFVTTTSIHHEKVELKYIGDPRARYEKIKEVIDRHAKQRHKAGKSIHFSD